MSKEATCRTFDAAIKRWRLRKVTALQRRDIPRKKVSREFVVARGDAPEILEPADAALDDIAALVGFLVITNALFAVGSAGDDRLNAVPPQ